MKKDHSYSDEKRLAIISNAKLNPKIIFTRDSCKELIFLKKKKKKKKKKN